MSVIANLRPFHPSCYKVTNAIYLLWHIGPSLYKYTNQYIYTVEALYYGQHWDKYKCPDYRGVLISGVKVYYKATFVSVLNTGVSSFQGILVSLTQVCVVK